MQGGMHVSGNQVSATVSGECVSGEWRQRAVQLGSARGVASYHSAGRVPGAHVQVSATVALHSEGTSHPGSSADRRDARFQGQSWQVARSGPLPHGPDHGAVGVWPFE